jgi:hypothetical protein
LRGAGDGSGEPLPVPLFMVIFDIKEEDSMCKAKGARLKVKDKNKQISLQKTTLIIFVSY